MSNDEMLFSEETSFSQINSGAAKGGSVLFGSEILAEFPTEEFMRRGLYGENIFNRSSRFLTIENASAFYKACVSELQPEKVFVCIGDCDSIMTAQDAEDFCEKYEWLLYEIHSSGVRKIYILPTFNNSVFCEKINAGLKKTASEYSCRYLDCRSHHAADMFFAIKSHLRTGKITFADALGAY